MAVAIGVILAALNLIQLMLHASCATENSENSRPPARYASHDEKALLLQLYPADWHPQ